MKELEILVILTVKTKILSGTGLEWNKKKI